MSETSRQTIRHVTVRGRVQGVGYRAWVEHVARQRALEGWVRNRKDGSVEALFAGPIGIVEKMVVDCREGPALAGVEDVEEQPGDIEALRLRPPGERFAVLPTI